MFSADLLAHLGAAIAYFAFSGLLALWGARTWLNGLLVFAAALTGVWACAVAFEDAGVLSAGLVAATTSIRDGCWIAVLLAVLRHEDSANVLWRYLAMAAGALVLFDGLFGISQLSLETPFGVPIDFAFTRIAVSIFSVILVENLLRNLTREKFWSMKLFGIGLAAIFIFNIVAGIPELLTHMPNKELRTTLPLVFLVVLPLFVVTAIRTPMLELRIHSSRRVVFHTTALIGAGLLMEGMALAALYIRHFGGTAETIISLVLLFAGMVGIALAAVSTSFRSRLRLFINENFFSYKYDYRDEWNKFIRSLSAWDEGGMAFRILRTLSELLDSPGGALWVWRDNWHQFLPAAKWSAHSEIGPISPDDPIVKPFEDEHLAYLEVSRDSNEPIVRMWKEKYPFAWLVVPLRYRSTLAGIAVLNKPRVKRQLDWEDRNLISLVSLQLAVYLVQEETALQLSDARQLEAFNKRVAFIVHDIKNTMGQLSLIVNNVARFGHEEEFRKDMVTTIRHSVDQLQELLERLKGEKRVAATKSGEMIDVVGLISEFVSRKRQGGLNITMQAADMPPVVTEIENRNAFVRVLDHIVNNALEAAPVGSPVKVGIEKVGDRVRIYIDDEGTGMTPQFITDELFRPLRTTKGKGLGIGAYQAKETMRELGGDLQVLSTVGQGTTVSLLLPVR